MSIDDPTSTEYIVSSGTPLTSVTVSGVATGTRTNGYFAVAVSVLTASGASDITGITWGGVAMSKAAEAGSGVPYAEWWYKLSDAGGTADVVISFSGTGVTGAHISIVWGNSDAALSLGDFGGVAATTEDPASISLDTTETGALCLGAYSTQDNNVATSGDTLVQDHDAGGNCAGSSYLIAGAPGTHTLDWDRNATGISTIFNMAAFEVYEPDVGSSPTVALNTADETVFNDSTPTLLFTGTDADGDDVRYNIQISDNPDFANGINLTFEHNSGSGVVHPNPTGGTVSNGTSADGNPQLDDRPLLSLEWGGGELDHIDVLIGRDETDTDGDALVRVYDIEGTPGTDAAPVGESGGSATPTAGWLAESDSVAIDNTLPETPDWITFDFTGAQRIRTEAGGNGMAGIDWIPAATTPGSNTITVQVGTAPSGQNGWIDGNSANYGVQTFGPKIRVYEEQLTLDKVSGTDAGFVNEDDGGDTDPFTSGDQVSYTVQAGDALDDGVYFWRVRGLDPAGTNAYGAWSETRSFSVSAAEPAPGVEDGYQPHHIDSAQLSQAQAVGVEEGRHPHTAGSTAVIQTHAINADGANQPHAIDGAQLAQNHSLNVSDGRHECGVNTAVLTQAHIIAVGDGRQGHTIDGVALSTGVVDELSVGDSYQPHAIDGAQLAQVHSLAVGDLRQGHEIALAALTNQVHGVGVADLRHEIASDEVQLSQAHIVAADDGRQPHMIASVSLAGTVIITVADVRQGHEIALVMLSDQVHLIQTAECRQGITSDGVQLSQHQSVDVEGSYHTQSIDGVTITETVPFIFLPASVSGPGVVGEVFSPAAAGTIGE